MVADDGSLEPRPEPFNVVGARLAISGLVQAMLYRFVREVVAGQAAAAAEFASIYLAEPSIVRGTIGIRFFALASGTT